jgi:hypothetical protein
MVGTTSTCIFGVSNGCATGNDVLAPGASYGEAISFYQPVGVNAPYVASVYHAPVTSPDYNWVALTNGWDIINTFDQYCATSIGRLTYYHLMLTNVFGAQCSSWGTPTVTLDVPQNGRGGQFVNFMKVGNSVMRSGNATVKFGVASTDRVRVRLYDVTGRLVRTLADRTFQPGSDYSLTWDGSDNGGNQVARGVYFARIEYMTKGAAINGRVVVLR